MAIISCTAVGAGVTGGEAAQMLRYVAKEPCTPIATQFWGEGCTDTLLEYSSTVALIDILPTQSWFQ